jgi:hypothetical protein
MYLGRRLLSTARLPGYTRLRRMTSEPAAAVHKSTTAGPGAFRRNVCNVTAAAGLTCRQVLHALKSAVCTTARRPKHARNCTSGMLGQPGCRAPNESHRAGSAEQEPRRGSSGPLTEERAANRRIRRAAMFWMRVQQCDVTRTLVQAHKPSVAERQTAATEISSVHLSRRINITHRFAHISIRCSHATADRTLS